MRIARHLRISLLVAAALLPLATALSEGPIPINSNTVFVPFIGAEGVSDFQSHKPPTEPGLVCYLVDSYEYGEWKRGGPRFTRPDGTGAWGERLLPSPNLVPIRAYYRAVQPQFIQSTGEDLTGHYYGPAFVPRELPDGSYSAEGWSPLPFFSEFEIPYVELCVEWAERPALLNFIDLGGGNILLTNNGPAPLGNVIIHWDPAPGAAMVGGQDPVLIAPNGGSIPINTPIQVQSPFFPPGTPIILDGVAPFPPSTTITPTGIFPGAPLPNQTAVTFDVIPSTNIFNLFMSCTTPAGSGTVPLPYPILAGETQPFALIFTNLPGNPTLSNFACTPGASTPLANAPAPAQLLLEQTSYTFQFDDQGAWAGWQEVIGIYNPLPDDVDLSGWSLSTFLLIDETPIAYAQTALDETIPAGGWRWVKIDDITHLYDGGQLNDLDQLGTFGSFQVQSNIYRPLITAP